MNAVPPATPLAQEIAARFDKLMGRGGRINQILAGGVGDRAPSALDEEIEVIKRNIEAQLTEYAAAINAADKFHTDWKARQPKGFRAKRRHGEAEA